MMMPGCDTQEHSLEMNLQRKIYKRAQGAPNGRESLHKQVCRRYMSERDSEQLSSRRGQAESACSVKTDTASCCLIHIEGRWVIKYFVAILCSFQLQCEAQLHVPPYCIGTSTLCFNR